MKTFVIADTHFGHKNIIEYCNRPFSSVAEMDSALISNWNSVVSKNDLVWVLGDFALGSKDYIKSILSSLNGRKNLILGNHDNHSVAWYHEVGFNFVSKYPIVLNDFEILSHEPTSFLNLNIPFVNIYGHIHDSPQYQTISRCGACVSVERIGYKPVELSKLVNDIIDYRTEELLKKIGIGGLE